MVFIKDEQVNEILDEIILQRRTHRRFRDEIPPDVMILDIIKAGLHAPFAAAALGGGEDKYFRRFFVVRKNSTTLAAIRPLIYEAAMKVADDLEHAVEADEHLAVQIAGFMGRLAMIRKLGTVPGIGTAPLCIFVAEKRGFPPVEQQSLAHCMENMWLKATASGLGFQLVSITAEMSGSPEFCKIIGLQTGRWALNGCAIGYPLEELPPSTRPPVEDVTTWCD